MKSSGKKIRALVFFDNDKGRDVELLMPLLYYAEKYLDIETENAFIFDIDKIRRYNPDLVILPNTIGSKNHFLISKYAHENGIKVFALVSEGNFRTDGTFDYWGYNTDRKFYQEYICLWSERTVDFLRKELPGYADKIVLTGATYFDRFKIYRFESRESFLKRYKLQHFRKVIGYAGWAFGKLYTPIGRMEMAAYFKENTEEKFRWMKEQQHKVEAILRQAIENNPDILFILKRHPNEIHPHYTQPDNNEMVRLAEYRNVLYLRNEEDVHTLINVADIWTAFESTTVIEAWMMKNIPTLFINPDPAFNRDMNYQGTVITRTYRDFQNYIDEYYATGQIKDFKTSARKEARKKIIQNVIGFADGMNHIRAGYYLEKTIENIQPGKKTKVKPKLLYLLRYLLLQTGRHFYSEKIFLRLPKFKKTVWIFKRFRLENIPKLKTQYWPYLEAFHKKNRIEAKRKNAEFFRDLFRF